MIQFSPGRGVQSRSPDRALPSTLDRAERKFLELYGPPASSIDDNSRCWGFTVESRLTSNRFRAPPTSTCCAGYGASYTPIFAARSSRRSRMTSRWWPIVGFKTRASRSRCAWRSFRSRAKRRGTTRVVCWFRFASRLLRRARRVATSRSSRPRFRPATSASRTSGASSSSHRRPYSAPSRGSRRRRRSVESYRLDARSALEELQSTREELDTWRQELLAARQELTRVHVALEYRAAQHQRALDELQEALTVTDDPSIVTTRDHRIRLLSRARRRALRAGPPSPGAIRRSARSLLRGRAAGGALREGHRDELRRDHDARRSRKASLRGADHALSRARSARERRAPWCSRPSSGASASSTERLRCSRTRAATCRACAARSSSWTVRNASFG